MEKILQDKVAIITGSGRGIGRATALMFAQEGAKVVVNDIDVALAEETASDIKKRGGEAITFPGDVTGPDFAEGITKAAKKQWGALHIIVNNAGYPMGAMIHKMSDEQWDAMMDIHLKAPFRIIRAAKPYFCDEAKKEIEERKSVARKIVNISSVTATMGGIGHVNYTSAKAGIVGLTKTMSREWGRYNVQVNCVVFGFMDTRLTRESEIKVGNKKIDLGMNAKSVPSVIPMIPLGRLGTVKEAAGAILFFASPLSDYVSGQVLTVGGGYAM
jgi:3-oxoacyl-[acyl-carrier protein] reductase